MPFMLRIALPAFLLVLSVGCRTVGRNGAPVTPQRPSFSSDTSTTAPGTVEIETGVTVDVRDSTDTPTSIKYGLYDRGELFLNLSPFQHLGDAGQDGEGFGDMGIGVRHRLWEDTERRASAALQLLTKLPTGDEDEGLSTGEVDFFAAGIATREYSLATVTAFYQLGVLGEQNDNDVDLEHGLALAAGRSLTNDLGIFGEVAATVAPEQPDTAFVTLGSAYALSPSLVLDAGFAVGLDSDAPDFQFLLGLTTNLGRIR